MSNLIVETVFSNNITGGNNDAVISYNSPTTFQSTLLYVVDGMPFATVAAATTTNSATNLVRPDFIIKGQMRGTYTWTPATGLSATTGSSVNAAPAASSVYTVLVSTGLCSTSVSGSVNVTPVPVLGIASTATAVCAGNPATLTATGAGSYSWNTVSTASSIVVSPLLNTVYTVSNQTLPCPMVSASFSLVSNPLPVILVAPSPTSVCPMTATGFTAAGGVSYLWNNGATSSVITVTPALTTVYTVTGTALTGCSSTQTAIATTYTLPSIVITPASASVCPQSAATFTASGGAATYSWSSGAQTAVTSVTPAISSTYTVTGISAEGCISTNTAGVTLWQLPVISISPASPTICSGESLSLSGSGASTYTWLSSNTVSSAISVSPAVNTTYSLSATDLNNCRNTALVNVVVDPCTGIVHQSDPGNQISVYPNPSNGLITAGFNFEGQKEVTISNSLGAVITRINTSATSENLDLSAQPKGVYMISVRALNVSVHYRIILQ